jgi:hypothetical protein
MHTSEEFGYPDLYEDGEIQFGSNMSNIVAIGEKSLFMRTSDLFICHSL